jgi:uncharacterized protein (DUF433 family)
MVALREPDVKPAEVVSVPDIMGGDWTVSGTRVPAETIVAYLRAGHTHAEILDDYPSLPVDGVEAVIRWAEKVHGPDWMRKRAAE